MLHEVLVVFLGVLAAYLVIGVVSYGVQMYRMNQMKESLQKALAELEEDQNE